MPTYSFLNTETDEEFELEMKMNDREEYLKNNPHVRQILTVMNVIDPVIAGKAKPPSDFQKYVLGKVKAGHPKGSVENKFGSIKKEI